MRMRMMMTLRSHGGSPWFVCVCVWRVMQHEQPVPAELVVAVQHLLALPRRHAGHALPLAGTLLTPPFRAMMKEPPCWGMMKESMEVGIHRSKLYISSSPCRLRLRGLALDSLLTLGPFLRCGSRRSRELRLRPRRTTRRRRPPIRPPLRPIPRPLRLTPRPPPPTPPHPRYVTEDIESSLAQSALWALTVTMDLDSPLA
jgi:hypothetical protein